ncbi:hypothetical protein [Prosthecobacter sp.]|uniref:hypothetical protein n=1 Tax=Prosthecobacter sp. TaxID=1965333 RepID=UPI0037838882
MLLEQSQHEGEEWRFEVDYVPAGMKAVRIGWAARMNDFERFQALRKVLSPNNGLSGPHYADSTRSHGFTVKGSPDDSHVRYAIAELQKAGWTPVFQGMAGPGEWDNHFPIKRFRPDYPLDSSDWLMLSGACGDGGIILQADESGMVAIARPEWAKKKSHCLNLLWCELAVSQEFKDSFEQAQLTGAVFRPLTYVPSAPGFHPKLYPNKPLPPCNRIYWMDSTVVAPWSLRNRRLVMRSSDHPLYGTLLGHTNEPLMGQLGEVGFDDAGYTGRGVDYSRAEMEALEGVDFMRMAEWMCERNGVWRSPHLVSQRFRKWARNFGCRLNMNGVKLRD